MTRSVESLPIAAQLLICISWKDITGLNRRTGIKYLVVAPKGMIETELLTFPLERRDKFIAEMKTFNDKLTGCAQFAQSM